MKLKPIDHLNVLHSELIACARYIKTWELIASKSPLLSKFPEYNNVFGFIQLDFMYRLIAMSVHKIVRDTKTYLLACLEPMQKTKLFKKSNIDKILKKLKQQYEKTYIQPFRNKPIAHMVYVETLTLSTGKSSADLLDVYELIAKLEHAVSYISHFMRNPDLLEGSFLLEENSIASLDAYFKESDTFIKDLNLLLADLLGKSHAAS